MEVGELLPEAARELAMLSAPGGRLPDDVLDYLVAHCEGVCLNIEQMATAFVESELLFLCVFLCTGLTCLRRARVRLCA